MVVTYGESRNFNFGAFFPLYVPGADFKFNTTPFTDIEVIVDVEELVTDSSFSLYPNPVNKILKIQIDHEISSILVYNSQGRLIKAESIRGSDYEFNVEDLSNGTYFLKVILADRKSFSIAKFIKT